MTKPAWFFALLFLALSSCQSHDRELKNLMEKGMKEKDKAEDVTLIYSQGGYTTAKLFAKTFNESRSGNTPYIEMNKGLKVDFYDHSLHVQTTLTARYGMYFESTSNVLVKDSVVVVNEKNEKLETEELIWNEKLQKFYTEKFVKISTPTQVIYGTGLEANQTFSWYKITNVKGVIGVKKSEIPSLN